MATTPNYGLVLPADGDQQDVAVLDSNFVTIDNTMKTNADAITAMGVGTWAAFTPNLGANFTLGNGTLVGQKLRKHNEETIVILLTFGSTTVFAGTIALTLPDAPSSDAIIHGEAMFRDASAGGYIAGKCFSLTQGASALSIFSAVLSGTNANLTAVNATNPFTWTTSDQLMVRVAYKID